MPDHNCADESLHDDHDHHGHDHTPDGQLGYNDNLFDQIDLANVALLNSTAKASDATKPWNTRLDESKFIESDADDQIIIRIPFTGLVRLKALLLKAGPGEHTPERITLFANAPSLDFNDIDGRAPTQELTVPQGRDVGEYALKTAKFSNISSVTLFVPKSQGEDTSRIYYIGFLGQWSQYKNQPVITVYEAQANLADHEKIQGMDGAFNTPGH